jgi:hypothetical protein
MKQPRNPFIPARFCSKSFFDRRESPKQPLP